MTFSQIILYVIGGIASIGVLGGGLGVLIGQFKKAPREENSEVMRASEEKILFWKNQLTEEKEIATQKEEKWKAETKEKDEKTNKLINELTREVGELKGQLNAKTKSEAEYLAILQDKDNSSQEFRKFVVDSMKNQMETHGKMIVALNDIHKMATLEHERDFTVNSTVTKN